MSNKCCVCRTELDVDMNCPLCDANKSELFSQVSTLQSQLEAADKDRGRLREALGTFLATKRYDPNRYIKGCKSTRATLNMKLTDIENAEQALKDSK